MSDESSSIREARRVLASNRLGVLVYDGTIMPCRFVLDGATGRPVLPVTPGVLDADEHVLYVPEEGDDALQLLAIPEEVDPLTDPGADRWRVYHGDPPGARWSRFALDCARLGRHVIDGADLMLPNALAAAEPELLRRLNARPAELAAAVRARTGIEAAAPLAVGVDPDGLDVRIRFDIARVPFESHASDRAAADAAIDALLRSRGN